MKPICLGIYLLNLFLQVPLAITEDHGNFCFRINSYLPEEHKEVYTVGVLAIRRFEVAHLEFNKTFSDYLSAAVGPRFDKPIRFETKPLDFLSLLADVEKRNVDFIYVNPSAYSCIESEYGAESLASQISQRKVGDQVYNLTRFGGVIATLSNRDDIQHVHDLRGKVVAAASISGLASGQVQFRLMQDEGMSYLNDPKQLVFTSDQGLVVKGLLTGEFDVGFIRTDQLERSIDVDGNPVDLSLFKIIDPKPGLKSDGADFPFPSSTMLYPEWNIAALPHVATNVAFEVQNAMIAIADHAKCFIPGNETQCEELRCDTTPEIAELSREAMSAGMYAGWRYSLSYMTLRSMQESIGFIEYVQETNTWKCLRPENLYESIKCPVGFAKKNRALVDGGCSSSGLNCGGGFQCVCQPCDEEVECIDSIKVLGRCVKWGRFFAFLLVPFVLVSLIACMGILYCKSNQLIKQAKFAAENEREINEFIAHEIRNPLSAAISASTFIGSVIQQDDLTDEERVSLREDMSVIDLSLRFMNDLLRSMLDLHRTSHSRLSPREIKTIDILEDVLEPIASMIYTRDEDFEVIVDCPSHLLVDTDRLRLNQIIMNLARNSARFVKEGFIRLKGDVHEGNVRVIVEDSGPGIPIDKRKLLFAKFQERLGTLNQGRGVGLSLCQKLVDLMDGEISLDETYVSGYKDYHGARLIVNLKVPPSEDNVTHSFYGPGKILHVPDELNAAENVAVQPNVDIPVAAEISQREQGKKDDASDLPPGLSVLIVDDDRILRKQGSRAFQRFLPDWTVREAASGEAALKIVHNEAFHVIFMDQYMTSVEHSLLGTETTRKMRILGVDSIICGLSANSLEQAFQSAGADHFILKPFPCQQNTLFATLRLLLSKRDVLTKAPSIAGDSSDLSY